MIPYNNTVIVANKLHNAKDICEDYFGVSEPPDGVFIVTEPNDVDGLFRPNVILASGWTLNPKIEKILNRLMVADT